MTPTKLLIGQILTVFAIVILGLWAATQWAAAMLAYQPELGPPWFTFGELPFYRPWSLFGWWSITASAGDIMSSIACSQRPSSGSGAAGRRSSGSCAQAMAPVSGA
jgi:type IV secretion system protein VirD4